MPAQPGQARAVSILLLLAVIASIGSPAIAAAGESAAPGQAHRAEPMEEPPSDRLHDHPVVLFEAAVDAAEARLKAAGRVATPRFAVRLLVIQLVLERAAASKPARVGFGS